VNSVTIYFLKFFGAQMKKIDKKVERPSRAGRPVKVDRPARTPRPSREDRPAKVDRVDRPSGEQLYGAHAIIEMLKAGRRKLISIYTTKPYPKSWTRVQPYLPKSVPNIQYVSKDVLDRMTSNAEHMGVVAWVSPFKFATKMFTPAKHPSILLLDSVQDVRNLGAILRSAYCTGVQGVVLCKSLSAPLTPAAIKAAAGLSEHLDIYVAASMKQAVVEAKQAGYTLYMAVLDGENAMNVQFKKPSCLVIGNEAVGIQPSMRKDGVLVTLPQRTSDISYNASVAAGILLFVMSQKLS
jgi:23S rRNA (guanosine2251-2'-O)-methyltransferase